MNKHIIRDYGEHRRSIIRPNGEYCGLEIFSYDPESVQSYLAENNTLKANGTAKKTSWKSWTCFIATDPHYDMEFDLKYKALMESDYRIDVLYEQSNHMWNDKKVDSGKDQRGYILDKAYTFDGENNVLKRIPVYTHWNSGVQTIHIEIPPNCYFMGVIIRRIVSYTANNYFGADAGKDSGNMMMTSATLSISDDTKPSELQCTIGYDDAFECESSPSGFYIDYMDEVNFYVRDDDNIIQRVFGGYVSSILPNSDRTELTLHCADRLVDGQNKYVLDEMKIQGGTTSMSEDEYTDGMTKDFKNYAHALKYLCDIHEFTLKSNISANNLVEGEKYSSALSLTYGKNKSIKSVKVNNGSSIVSKNFITLRNNPSKEKKQVFTVYDASKQGKVAPDITDRGYMHITYGLGSPKTEIKSKKTETVDVSDEKAGMQKFTKCGVSEDKKYVMGIGQYSSSKGHKGLSYSTIYKTIFENKCPHCGKATLRWDSCRSDTKCIFTGHWNGTKGSWGGGIPETEITCTNCDSDYDSVTGYEKDSPWKKLKVVASHVKSSKAEQTKLYKGQMKAIPKTGTTITPDSIFKAITKIAFKYKYKRGGGGQTYAQMKKLGYGDCHGFSDLIFKELKSYGVTCKIVQYSTGASNTHRSVLYKNEKKQWTDFPYREYGWDKKYKNMLNNISKSKSASKVESYKGTNIGNVKVKSKTTTKSKTTEVTTTKGYDNTKPFQGYLKITYSNTNDLNAKKKSLNIKFTLSTIDGETINNKGFPLYWVNNNSKKSTLIDSNEKAINIIDRIRTMHNNPKEKVYLQSIQFIAPLEKSSDGDKENTWYSSGDNNHDESSCKMDLYQISFDANNQNDNGNELKSCGKSINSMIQDIVKDTGYLVSMTYGKHRVDDRINFRVNNTTISSFTAREGDNNNILNWGSISYNPVSSMHNSSVHVFKDNKGIYYYVDTRTSDSILRYGEQTTLETSNEPISDSEAYFNARMNEKYNTEQTYSYTITVPNYPHLRLGDLVTVIANAKKLNSVKEVKSLKISFDWNKMPRIQTEIGLDELAPSFQLKQNIRSLKENAKKTTTSFSSSAIPVTRIDLYEWDR